MKLAGTYSFEAPLDTVWQGLFDPEVLARTLPGCDKLERQGDQFVGEINVKMGPVQGKFQGKVDIQNVKGRESYTMVVDGRGPAGFAKATAHIRVASEGTGTRLDYDSDVQVGGKIASVGQRLLDASSRAIVKQSLEGLHEQLKALAARSAAAAPVAATPAPAPVAAPPPSAPGASGAAIAEGVALAGVAGAGVAPVGIAPPVAAARLPPPVSPAVAAAAAVPVPAPRAPSQTAFAIGVAKEVTKEMLPRKVVWPLVALLVAAWLLYRFS